MPAFKHKDKGKDTGIKKLTHTAKLKKKQRESTRHANFKAIFAKHKKDYLDKFCELLTTDRTVYQFLENTLKAVNIPIDEQELNHLIVKLASIKDAHSETKGILRRQGTIIDNPPGNSSLLNELFALEAQKNPTPEQGLELDDETNAEKSFTEITSKIAVLSNNDRSLCDSFGIAESYETHLAKLKENASYLNTLKVESNVKNFRDPYDIISTALNINSHDQWVDIAVYLHEVGLWSGNEPIGIEINRGKISEINHLCGGVAHMTWNVLGQIVLSIPVYVIKIGQIGFKVTGKLIFTIMGIILSCSTRLTSLVQSLALLNNLFTKFTHSPYPIIIMSLLRQLLIEPVFNINGNNDNLQPNMIRKIEDAYTYRIFCNIFSR